MKDLEQAVELMGNRRSDAKLQGRVRDFLVDDIPEILKEAGVPVWLTPYVAGGTNAEVQFTKEATVAGGRPVVASYVEDDFTITNAAKVGIWRPKISWPSGQITRRWIVDAPLRENMVSKVGTAETMYGCDVQTYQSRLANMAFMGAGIQRPEVIDLSAWYGDQSSRRGRGRAAVMYYPAVMAVAAACGVLFRYEANNPLTARFREQVATPAAGYVRERLGVSPIIFERSPVVNGEFTNLSSLDLATTDQLQNSEPSVTVQRLVL